MELKAIYKEKCDCRSCIDTGFANVTYCSECVKMRRKEVVILQLGVGTFSDKAIVKTETGKLLKVSIDDLTVK